MAKTNNFKDFLADYADGLRTVEGSNVMINPQDFRTHTENIVKNVTADANATADNIVAGKTAYINGTKITGTMVNRGTVNSTLSSSTTSYTIPAGYHNGSGKVSVNTQEKSVNITSSDIVEVTADTGYVLSKVTVNTDIKQNYCLVRFYNDDRTTVLYETYVPYGGNAVYAGRPPISTNEGYFTFINFEPSSANVTEDMECYAVYEQVSGLNDLSWEDISIYSETGVAENYFALGDMKAVTINGKVGNITINETLYAYIIGFNHNSELEGNGIHFGTFKNATGKDICLVDNYYGRYADSDSNKNEYASDTYLNSSGNVCGKSFSMNHRDGYYQYGYWAACELRYDILGSTDKKPKGYSATYVSSDSEVEGYDPSSTCATNPVPNTLMAALPADLRAVMKPMTKYTKNKSGTTTATIEYLPLLAEFEFFGVIKNSSDNSDYQRQYDYFKTVGILKKFKHTDETRADTLLRSPRYQELNVRDFCTIRVGVSDSGNAESGWEQGDMILGIAPIFKV